MDALMLIGRIVFAAIFVFSGISHFTKLEPMTGYATFKKVPSPKLAVALSGMLFLASGISVILGIYADLGALVIAVLLVIISLKMHDFWTQTEAQAKQVEMTSFTKNFSMAGAALFLFAFASSEGANIGWTLTNSLF